LIVASMASRLSDHQLERVRIVTYGSQIRQLYGRIFPRVFGPDDVGYDQTRSVTGLRNPLPDVPSPGVPVPVPVPPAASGSLRGRLESAGGAWFNLFRRTDPLGWRVFTDVDSNLDLPVPEVPRAPQGDPGPSVMTHSGYQHTRTYRGIVHAWTGERL